MSPTNLGGCQLSATSRVSQMLSNTDQPIVRPGQNAWRVERAERASVLVDGANYYENLEAVLRKARKRIVILGWDFDGRVRLRPDVDPQLSPPLGVLLRQLVTEQPDLHVHILVWSIAVLHAPSAPSELLLEQAWQHHPRIRLVLDTHHPIYAAHHQKVVTVDDSIAFVGGIDLTVRRWDSPNHAAHNPMRLSPEGEHYFPVHDMQMVVDGPAARSIAELAHQRWNTATGEALEPVLGQEDLWPPNLTPDFRNSDIAIARTMPELNDQREVCEAAHLTADCLKAARKVIYIEGQYLAAPYVVDVLAELLGRDEGPEVVLVLTWQSHGFIERFIMGNNRDRAIRRLVRADRHGRFRAVYPVVPSAGGEQYVHIHAKLIIVDDRFLRVGSSNLNNRSIGLDTECDLAIEAAAPEEAKAIRRIRLKLIAEHLGVVPEAVAEAIDRHGLVATIDTLGQNGRGMRRFKSMSETGPRHPAFWTFLFDPKRPYRLMRFLRRMVASLMAKLTSPSASGARK
ncbi:phospholipase [Agaricicola taiwanensis]|uniref:Phospholipase D n=1 Tax=Agaricicola taiwanensis TaxID=591372 RepID=A0A8J2YKP5_9RHOB|nr:phospholipase D-like domain-containing protein [Agaricicola taiwanensis]GGE49095.1 phospholipase [Agaricicola taiwanensis]